MDNDDEPVGRVLTRREILALFGAAGTLALAGGAKALADTAGDYRTHLSLIQTAPDGTTPTATSTPTATGTGVPTGTATATGTSTATATGVPGTTTPTSTGTVTATEVPPTGTATATGVPPTATATATGVPNTATPTVLPTGTPLPACIVRPEQTEGPYFVDERLNRSDIRSDPSDGTVRPGVQLKLNFRVSEISTSACTPLPNVFVDVWHCDAAGDYSDVQSEGTLGKKFLRGYQVTDALGAANFVTIYPGWYPGRTVHIHFKIRTQLANTPTYEFTSQLYFDDTLTDQVYLQKPYNSRPNRTTRNNNDGIYNAQLLMTVVEDDVGYTATFDLGVMLD